METPPRIGDAVLLDAWERSRQRPAPEKPLALLEALQTAGADETVEDPSALPLGTRDRRLLELRLQLLGSALELTIDCPSCAETLEMTVDARELLDAYGEPGAREAHPRDVSLGDLTVRLRPVNGSDLARAGQAADSREAEACLLERCVLEARRDGEPVSVDDFDDEQREALAAALGELDPDAEILLDLSCAACGHSYREPFDVAACVAAEIETHGARLLEEVAALARGYGWREADVLALSRARRRAYLDLLG